MSARYAIYYAPAFEHVLWRRASAWLGRDAATGAVLRRDEFPALADLDLDAVTAEPRGYGFHGTLRAPFELRPDAREADLVAAAQELAAQSRAFETSLAPAALGPFLAMLATGNVQHLQALHEKSLHAFEPFRAPLSEYDIARRRAAALTPAQDAHMLRWGYPYVLEFFRFHMTLTGPIRDGAVRDRVLTELTRHFAEVSGPHRCDGVCIFKQQGRDAPFTLLRRFTFAG